MSKNEFDALLLKKMQEEAFEYKPESWHQLSERLHIAMPVQDEAPSFDGLLAAKLQEDTFEYNPASWKQLAARLDPDAPEHRPETVPFSPRKWGIALGTAAALCITIGLAVKWNQPERITGTDKNNAVVNNTATKPSLPQATENKQNNTATQGPVNTVPSAKAIVQPSSAVPNNTVQHHNYAMQPGGPLQNTVVAQPVIPQQVQAPSILLPQENTPAPVSGNTNVPVIAKAPAEHGTHNLNKEMTAPAVQQERASDYIVPLADITSGAADRYVGAAAARPKTNIAFGGGMNYGNINTGYTAGISLKHRIGDFFVDGTVAMMYNNNANNVAANNGPSVVPPAGTASKPAKNSISSFSAPALDPIQKLYYVQMNPSFGYQVEDKVALSVGGDFQKMLNKKDEIVQPDNNNTKIFPTMDIGLTTKSEFTITPNLQAGLMYREGLNNLFKSDAPYVNRRYVQVQFKYNIPLK